MTREESDYILNNQYGTETQLRSTRQWADEVTALQAINRALDTQLRAAEARLELLDGAANTRVHQLEGELATWRLAAWAMLAVWLVTVGMIAVISSLPQIGAF